jgi:cardiolipin synthase
MRHYAEDVSMQSTLSNPGTPHGRDVRVAVTYRPIAELRLDPLNPRQHSRRQIRQIARSIEAFGFTVPVLVDADLKVIAGHGRVMASKELGLHEVPTITLEHLSEAQARAYLIADNRLAENASWDERLLGEQLKGNWFYSGFQSFEASVRLRDPSIVADVLDELAELSRGSDGHWTDLTTELARLGHEIRRHPAPGGPRAEAALVLGPQHAHYVRQARDTAQRRIVVTSHRFGAAGRPIVVLPTMAAAKAKNIPVKVFWGTTSGGFRGEDAARVTAAAGSSGVTIQPVHEPRLHAKLLAWDDDFLVITSQNWLSADPSEANSRREIGIFLHATAVARLVVEHLEAIRR